MKLVTCWVRLCWWSYFQTLAAKILRTFAGLAQTLIWVLFGLWSGSVPQSFVTDGINTSPVNKQFPWGGREAAAFCGWDGNRRGKRWTCISRVVILTPHWSWMEVDDLDLDGGFHPEPGLGGSNTGSKGVKRRWFLSDMASCCAASLSVSF